MTQSQRPLTQKPDRKTKTKTKTRPGWGKYARLLFIGPVDNTFKIEGFLDLVWCDPRLRFDIEEIGFDVEFFLEEDAELALNRIWWPGITIVNEVGRRDIENEELLIRPDGTIEYEEKFSALMEVNY